jgi:hypothetical protein
MVGGEDLNLRPTDYEFDLGPVADLLKHTKSDPDLRFRLLNVPRHFASFRGPSRGQHGATRGPRPGVCDTRSMPLRRGLDELRKQLPLPTTDSAEKAFSRTRTSPPHRFLSGRRVRDGDVPGPRDCHGREID